MKLELDRKGILCLAAVALLAGTSLHAQHGVVREYAALAPKPDAVALSPLIDVPLSAASITLGPDQAFYLTGSPVEGGQAVPSEQVRIWRSTDLKTWREIRTLDLGPGKYRSPELRYLKGAFWLALDRASGGTELVKFDGGNLAASPFTKAVITEIGITPSLFLDEDGVFFWILGGGRIARMKADPLQGLAGEPKSVEVTIAGPAGQRRDQRILDLRGAHLTKIGGKYHLFITARLTRNGLGRTGRTEGAEDVLVAASDRPDEGYGAFYVAFPNAGETTLFKDGQGAWWATWSGSDEQGILRGRPGAFRIEQVAALESRWPIGFAANEPPTRFPFNLMLRPDTSLIYERGMGFARAVPLDRVPGQKANNPWLRDTFIMVGPDGNYYLTGTSGNMDGINLWRSADLNHFEFVKQAWTPKPDPDIWYNSHPKRLFWAPELHYIKGTYWIPFCLSAGERGKNSLLKSVSGKPEGPYEPAFSGNQGVDQDIDSSLFQDTDGSVYYVWQDGKIRKLNDRMNAFEGAAGKLLPADGQRVGYEGATLVRIGAWYVLTAAEWNGGGNRSDGTYDMMYSCATNLAGPWHPRRVAVPHAGHGSLFKNKAGRWHASFFGNDRTAPFRAMPGFVPVEVIPTDNDLVIRPGI